MFKRFSQRQFPRRIALALGSGAARGWAHIGIIEELLAQGIQISHIAGTSMGALVGAMFAAGRLADLHAIARRLDWRQMIYYFLDLTFPRSGLIDGGRIADFVRQHIKFARIEELERPFRAVATDILSGREYVFDRGEIVEAVRASIAVPGMFTPLMLGDKILVDGGLVNPVPVSVARAMTSDYVIAVDVNYHWHAPASMKQMASDVSSTAGKNEMLPAVPRELQRQIQQILLQVKTRLATTDSTLGRTARRWIKAAATPGIFDVLGNSIRILEAQVTEMRLQLHPPDLLVRPALPAVSFMDFHRAREIIQIGRQAMRAALTELAPTH